MFLAQAQAAFFATFRRPLDSFSRRSFSLTSGGGGVRRLPIADYIEHLVQVAKSCSPVMLRDGAILVMILYLQGDQCGRGTPFVDIDLKVLFQYKSLILKHNSKS